MVDADTLQRLKKPTRGARVLAKEDADAKAAKVERDEKAATRARDGRCRWPEPHKCRCGLESAHIVDASRMGPMHRSNLVTLCGWLHRRGPESIHGKQLKVEVETPAGAQGALSFWRQGDDGEYYLVRREIRPFEYERD